ncbi:MAG TPA: N-acetyltransferase [Terracidiphilus sp.]|nr:N-acetyltransferase [Terracidiphilus sp.]
MLYRLYRPADFPQLYAIEQACFQPPFRFPRRYMQQLVASSAAATWIAEEDQQMTGFAIVEWNNEEGITVAYIQTLEVAPAQRRRGIATELLSRVESSAHAAGAHVLWLHAAESNVPAIHLYRAHGYLPQGREENYYARGIPALIYAKPLEPPPAA